MPKFDYVRLFRTFNPYTHEPQIRVVLAKSRLVGRYFSTMKKATEMPPSDDYADRITKSIALAYNDGEFYRRT